MRRICQKTNEYPLNFPFWSSQVFLFDSNIGKREKPSSDMTLIIMPLEVEDLISGSCNSTRLAEPRNTYSKVCQFKRVVQMNRAKGASGPHLHSSPRWCLPVVTSCYQTETIWHFQALWRNSLSQCHMTDPYRDMLDTARLGCKRRRRRRRSCRFIELSALWNHINQREKINKSNK